MGIEPKISYLEGCHLCMLIWYDITKNEHYPLVYECRRKRKTRVTQARNGNDLEITIHPKNRYAKTMNNCNLQARVRLSRSGLDGDKKQQITSQILKSS